MIECQGGWRHRAKNVECPSRLPRATVLPPSPQPASDACTRDTDCPDVNAYCSPSLGQLSSNFCFPGCVRDSDCGEGNICQCGEFIGACVKASCVDDASCGDGVLCASYTYLPGCDMPAFACQAAGDRCASDAHCTTLERCTLNEQGFRVCAPLHCVEGRPFLVAGEERLAPLRSRRDFLASGLSCEATELSTAARARLAEAWAQIGLMEHASIAAFARFTLELLAFGAPAELVASASQAMVDELEHARTAFSLASRYQGEAVGPGPLAVEGSLAAIELESCALTAFLEGCIGETVAALQARAALAVASDSAVREVLSRVAEDEARHAQLAWRFLKWVLPRCGREFPARLWRAFASEAKACANLTPSVEPLQAALHAHGVLTPAEQAQVRSDALLGVVEPCLKGLLEAASVGERDPSSAVAAG